MIKNLPPKIRKSFRQLGRGHFAQLAFWKFCFRERYSFGKNVLAVWFNSGRKTISASSKVDIIFTPPLLQSLDRLCLIYSIHSFIHSFKKKKKSSRCSVVRVPHFLLVLFLCDLGFGNQHKNLIYNPCHLITHKSPQCVCSPHNRGHSAFLWPQQQCPCCSLFSYMHLEVGHRESQNFITYS